MYKERSSKCSGYQCWESVLTYVSQMEILDIFNSYRQTVARGTCGKWCETNKERVIFTLMSDDYI